ncbi:I78 family peptidase inhibitor [Novosphingobium sp. BL-8H]|uniref:I78 family peptidase inhibitor n=1 Tax=Novosphingobium sp. BL-8H TaxID=3127640 RepID=UPI003757A832
MKRTFLPILAGSLALAVLTACASSGTSTGTSSGTDKVADAAPPPPSMEPNCGADQLSAYVGQPASDEVIAAITQWRGDKPMRVLKPGMAVTMDYRPDRLNVQVGDDGKIKGFNCT